MLEASYVDLSICGETIRVRSGDEAFLASLRERYAHFLGGGRVTVDLDVRVREAPIVRGPGDPDVVDSSDGRFVVLSRHDFVGLIAASGRVRSGMAIVSRTLTSFDSFLRVYLSNRLASEEGMLLHSCGLVVGREGWVFPGVSGAGKTTLARKADPRDVLSDELTVIRRTNGRWVAQGTPFWGAFQKGLCNRTVPLRAVGFLNRRSPAGVRPLGPADAATRFLTTFLFFSTALTPSRAALALVTRAVREIPCFEISYPRSWPMARFVLLARRGLRNAEVGMRPARRSRHGEGGNAE